jgi:hypothetical protein
MKRKAETTSTTKEATTTTRAAKRAHTADTSAWLVIVWNLLQKKTRETEEEETEEERGHLMPRDLINLASACRETYTALHDVGVHAHSLFYRLVGVAQRDRPDDLKDKDGDLVSHPRLVLRKDEPFRFEFEPYESGYNWMYGPGLNTVSEYETGEASYIARSGQLFPTDVDQLAEAADDDDDMPGSFREKTLDMPEREDLCDIVSWENPPTEEDKEDKGKDDEEDEGEDDEDEEAWQDNDDDDYGESHSDAYATWGSRGWKMRLFNHCKYGWQLAKVEVAL